MNAKVIAIAMQKGGVGKTTTCANLGIGLAQKGKKVLIVDSNPQGSLSISLGHAQPDNIPTTLATVMGKVITDTPLEHKEGILVDLLRDTYGGKIKVFVTDVPHSVRAAEISAEGKSIFAHDLKGKVAESY